MALTLVDHALQHEIEQFLYTEAEFIDDRRFEDWLTLIADDVRYWMPIRENRMFRDTHQEAMGENGGGHFDDDKVVLAQRVRKLGLQRSWSEMPASRSRHLITNVRIRPREDPNEFDVRSSFHFYRSRHERQVDNLVGGREDVLRRTENGYGFEIARRTIYLDQSVILTHAITTFL